MNSVAFIDHLLRDREQIAQDLGANKSVASSISACFLIFVTLTFIYGLVMGSQSLIRGYDDGWKYMLASAVKLPLLFLLSISICLPLLYVLNILIGPKSMFRQVFGMIIASIAVSSIVLGACAPIVLFFMLSTSSYAFVKIMNVAVFAFAGLYGVWFLKKTLQDMVIPVNADEEEVADRKRSVASIIQWWMLTYGFVGSQMAWILRPYVGEPGRPFSFFRSLESNFYLDVLRTLGRLMALE